MEAFQNAEPAIAHSTGMAHANIDQLLAGYQVRRKVALSVPGFHVLPMLIPNSDLVAVVPGMLAEAYASHTCPSKCSRCRCPLLTSISVSIGTSGTIMIHRSNGFGRFSLSSSALEDHRRPSQS